MADKPNIVYIFSDQHRGDALGCAGHPAIKTPCIDKLASEGVVFNRCHTNGPVCMASRASMMTGQYVREHGVWGNVLACDAKGPSHVRQIRDAGYRTSIVGKTHLYMHSGSHSKDKVEILKDWGFEDIHELHGPHASGTNESPYSDYLRGLGLWETHRDYVVRSKGRLEAGQARPWEDPPCPLPSESHLDSYTGKIAAEWVRDYDGDQPFYLQVLFPGPHNPFDSPQEYRDWYSPEEMPEGITQIPEGPHSDYMMRSLFRAGDVKTMTVEEKQQILINYYAKISLIDAAIGKIVEALEKKGELENTWVIYSSDHGEMAGDHRLSHKSVFYDAAARVPLVIRPPGGVKKWTSEALVDCIDVTASMLNVAGARAMEGSEGRSLTEQVLAGPDADGAQEGKDALISEISSHTMVFDGRYKLVVEALSDKPTELYDWESDPDEVDNLADDPGMESVRKDLIETHLNRIRGRLDEGKLQVYEDIVKG